MTIRAKLSVFAGALVLLTTISIGIIGYLLQKRLIERHVDETEAGFSSSFAAVCRQALTVNNDLFMVNYVKLLQESPGIAYAYFVDPSGRILVHSDARFIYKEIWRWRRPPGTREMSASVLLGRTSAGNAVVGFSNDFRRQRVQEALRTTFRQVIAATSGVAALGLAAAVALGYLLTRPIKALFLGSEQIAKGNFQVEVPVTSRDELGELTGRFNSMAKSLAILDELKDEFISNVSHDLRNPMAAIQMFADHLLNTDEDRDKLLPRHRDALVTIMDNARRLGLFVTNVLDAAKIKAGRMEYHAQPVAVEDVAQNVQSLFNIVANKRRIHLLADLPVGLPRIVCDPERFEQVIANLVSNALKYTDDGGSITFGARVVDGRVDIRVADTGRGIPSAELPKLFGRFNQADVADQRAKKIKGTGLGLYIVKKTIEDMGGAIMVESVIKKGTTFTISMPAAPLDSGRLEIIQQPA